MKRTYLMKVSKRVDNLVYLGSGTPNKIKQLVEGESTGAGDVRSEEVDRALSALESNGRCAYMYGSDTTYILLYSLTDWSNTFAILSGSGGEWQWEIIDNLQMVLHVLDRRYYQPLCDLVLGKVPVVRLVDGSYAMLKETLDRAGLDWNGVGREYIVLHNGAEVGTGNMDWVRSLGRGFRSLEAGEVYLEHNEYALTIPQQGAE